jgi:hypothetical protein
MHSKLFLSLTFLSLFAVVQGRSQEREASVEPRARKDRLGTARLPSAGQPLPMPEITLHKPSHGQAESC